MVNGSLSIADGENGAEDAFLPLFSGITSKQHEVMVLVAENRSSKEIASRLGVSESAVNQRIEAVRGRAGYVPRAVLAREYRRYQDVRGASRTSLEHIQRFESDAATRMDGSIAGAGYGDGLFDPHPAPAVQAVPVLLDGANGALIRVAAMVVIAAGILIVALFALIVGEAISRTL